MTEKRFETWRTIRLNGIMYLKLLWINSKWVKPEKKKTCAPSSEMYSLALLTVHRHCPYSTVSLASSPVRSISSACLLSYLQQSAAFAGFDHHVWELLHPWSPTEEINDSERLQVLRHTAGRRWGLRIHFVIKWQNLDETKGDTMGVFVNNFRRKTIILSIGQYTGLKTQPR